MTSYVCSGVQILGLGESVVELWVVTVSRTNGNSQEKKIRRRRKRRRRRRRRRTPAMAVFMEPFSLHDAVANEEIMFQCGCFPFLGRTRKKTATTMKTAV